MTVGYCGNCYAQTGWLKYSWETNPNYFIEYWASQGWTQKRFNEAASGSFNVMKVYDDGNYFRFYINSNQVWSASKADIGWTAEGVQFFGEVHDTNDQSPGSVVNPVSISYSSYLDGAGVWQPASLTPSTGLSTQRTNLTQGGRSFEIWDSRY